MPSITHKGKEYFVDPKDCQIDWQMVDNGIGPYEFWGAKYVDKQMEPEIISVQITKAEDEEGTEITDREILDSLQDAVQIQDRDWAEFLTQQTCN